jgi:LCP family protein required for cell wall assembly
MPGAFPSAPLGPVNRYAAWHRSPWRIAGKILGWLVITLVVAAGALGGGVWLYLNESVNAVQAKSEAVKQTEKFLDAPAPGEPTVAIVIGYDTRKGVEASLGGRSDTIMLLRADPATDTLSMLSFPRDLVVEHPGCPAHPDPWVDRINTAFTFCGPSGTVRTVKQLTGVPINYVITVNFSGFKQIVNNVGGVYVDVDRRYFNDNSGSDQYATINLQPGYQKLTGGAALDYARFRHTDSDIHRNARQQAFVKSLKQQVSASISLTKLPGIINVITDTVEVGRGGKGKLDVGEVLGYARFLYELPSGHFFQTQIDGLTGYAELEAPTESIQAAVRDFLNPDVDAAEKATQAAAGGKVETATPRPSEVTVTVLNGNGEDGAASDTAYLLGQRGYLADSGGDADAYDYFNTVVRYNAAQAGAEAAATALAKQFGDAEIEAAGSDVGFDTMLEVVVGQTFTGKLAPIAIDRTPEHQPAAVVRDYDEVLPLLRQAQKKVDFPVLVPVVRDDASVLDSEVPVRVYTVDRKDAIRIVYQRSYGGYYGIQQTSWTDAPILQGASVEKRVAGRTYRLYYDGAKLQMVAFEQDGSVYWVSNTLLNELSNETMIAIAKGLKPLTAVK